MRYLLNAAAASSREVFVRGLFSRRLAQRGAIIEALLPAGSQTCYSASISRG